MDNTGAQSERAYLKQAPIFENRKRYNRKVKATDLRFVKNAGLGIKTPKEVSKSQAGK